MSLLYSNDLCSAFLAEIVRAFETYHRKHYLGRTAMQKLAYFSQALGVPIPCSFEIYNFGPYSDAVTFSVESMLADDILQDISSNEKYSNYRLKPSAPQFEKPILNSVYQHRKKIHDVVKALGKFGPAQLELIATLHFIATKMKSLGQPPIKQDVLEQFVRVKKDKFSEAEVSSWYDSLHAAKLI